LDPPGHGCPDRPVRHSGTRGRSGSTWTG
jgi:hypothetical protein